MTAKDVCQRLKRSLYHSIVSDSSMSQSSKTRQELIGDAVNSVLVVLSSDNTGELIYRKELYCGCGISTKLERSRGYMWMRGFSAVKEE